MSGAGKPLGNYSSTVIADAVLAFLKNHKDFYWWWAQLGGDMCRHDREALQDEIRNGIAEVIHSTRHPEDLKSPTFGQLRDVLAAARAQPFKSRYLKAALLRVEGLR